MTDDKVVAILKTTDVAATIEWYRRVGFEVLGTFPEAGDPTWCELSRDGVVLQFLFHPESVEALYEEIKDHTPPAWGPEVRDWGARELGLRDPNG